jgi:hypothetical protein
MNSCECALESRFTGDRAGTTERFDGSKFDYYSKHKGADGKLRGESSSAGAPLPPKAASFCAGIHWKENNVHETEFHHDCRMCLPAALELHKYRETS